jgi:hypothetical protein
MQTLSRAVKRHGQWLALAFIALVPRLCLLRVYDIELSQDGFDAVKTLTILQAQGIGAVPRDLIDRFILHPLYMLLLAALRVATPASIDFYVAARLLSALIASVAIILLFEFTRRAFGDVAAWVAALFLAFAPSFLWESVAILSSTTFLALYIAVLLALLQSRYRFAASLAFLAAITRYEGVVLLALVFFALLIRDVRARTPTPSPSPARRGGRNDWLIGGAFALAFPLTLVAAGALATGNAFEFLGAQSMASIWLRFLAPGDFAKRGAFFITQYAALFPALIVWLGIAGASIALVWHRHRATALLLGTSALYLLFFEVLVWFNYTTLEVRFLMYPGLPLLVCAGVALAQLQSFVVRRLSFVRYQSSIAAVFLAAMVAALCVQSYQQGDLGIRFIYNSMASMQQMADELVHLVPPNQETRLMVYSGNSGALDMFAQQRGLHFTFTDFRFVPDDNPEQYLIDRKIQFVIYPVGNAFAQAKYPYLTRFETQTHGAVTFKPITQFATSTDNQLYSIWAVSY